MSKKISQVKLRRPRYSLFDSIEHQVAPRVLLVDFFYWPFISAGSGGIDPLAVVAGNGVVTDVSPKAFRAGVRAGDRVRAATSAVTGLQVISVDAIDQGGLFAKIANVLERFSPLIEIVDIGVCGTNARGPSRYFGGEERLALEVRKAMEDQIVEVFPPAGELLNRAADLFAEGSVFSFGVSIADGIFTAKIAARR